jgi:hypothetical protein
MKQLPLRVSKPGPILEYLEHLRAQAADVKRAGDDHGHLQLSEAVARAETAVRTLFATEDGRVVLDLLEKATTWSVLDPLSDVRALEARNAQRFIALDLRRIASDERTELEKQVSLGARGRNGRRRHDG